MRNACDNALLNLLYKGTTTIQDFCWDNLNTTPILYLIPAEDVEYIRKIITSPRYSGNNKLKMEKIDEVMHFRGFTRFAGGTNRLVYTHPSAPNAVFKVAIDSVGINDNPAEFRNQMFLKPYCCKVFECSPCGTIASFEKVDRITTFEEFYTIADDYFYLLSRLIIGKYVMEDIGIDYFMNVGIRKGFGVVILDFPYLFELDGAKLECSSILDDGSICKGEIDYDHGFNKLICSKCGRVYRARDLAKPPKDGGMLVYKKGGRKMEIKIVQGDKVIKSIATGAERTYLSKFDNRVSESDEDICSKKPHLKAKIVTETVKVPADKKKDTKPAEPAKVNSNTAKVDKVDNNNRIVKKQAYQDVVVSFGNRRNNPMNNVNCNTAGSLKAQIGTYKPESSIPAVHNTDEYAPASNLRVSVGSAAESPVNVTSVPTAKPSMEVAVEVQNNEITPKVEPVEQIPYEKLEQSVEEVVSKVGESTCDDFKVAIDNICERENITVEDYFKEVEKVREERMAEETTDNTEVESIKNNVFEDSYLSTKAATEPGEVRECDANISLEEALHGGIHIEEEEEEIRECDANVPLDQAMAYVNDEYQMEDYENQDINNLAYSSPSLVDNVVESCEIQAVNDNEGVDIIRDNYDDDDEYEEDELSDIIFVDKLPAPEDAKENAAYCVKLFDYVDSSELEKEDCSLDMIPCDLYAIFIKDPSSSQYIRYIVDEDGELAMYKEDEEPMFKPSARELDITPFIDDSSNNEQNIHVNIEESDEDELIAQLKASSKKASLEGIDQ